MVTALYSTLEVSITLVGASNGGSQFNFLGPVNNEGILILERAIIGDLRAIGGVSF